MKNLGLFNHTLPKVIGSANRIVAQATPPNLRAVINTERQTLADLPS